MTGIRIGIAVLIAAWCGAYAVTGDKTLAFLITLLVLVILPPAFDPAIQTKENQIKRGEHPES